MSTPILKLQHFYLFLSSICCILICRYKFRNVLETSCVNKYIIDFSRLSLKLLINVGKPGTLVLSNNNVFDTLVKVLL